MKKIGIITFHRSYNYGSVLQAYALQQYLSEYEYDVKIIDFVQRQDFAKYKIFRTQNYLKNPKSFVADILFLRKNLQRKISFSKFIDKQLKLTSRYYENECLKSLNLDFDAYICGGDQIWNPVCTQGVEPAYYLKFADASKKKIAYAPSIAHLIVDNKYIIDMKQCIQSLDAVSIREKESLPFLNNIIGVSATVVLDPTLILNKEKYTEITFNVNENSYIFVYMLEKSDELIIYAAELSRETKKKIIYISKRNERKFTRSSNVYGCSPEMFLGYIKNADYVVTNSFHATVFCILFEKQFVTFKTELSYSRMVDLLDSLAISNRLYPECENIDENIKYDIVENKLDLLKQSSEQYLSENLL